MVGVLMTMAAATAGCAVPGAARVVPAGTTTSPIDLSPGQAEMLGDLNAQRAAAGVGPLAACGTLQDAALGHSADQADTNLMSHTGSNGSDIGQRADASGYIGWTNLGENVAYGYTTVASVMTAWMNSPGHRANILDPAFHDVGLGEAASSNGTDYWTQDFGGGGHC